MQIHHLGMKMKPIEYFDNHEPAAGQLALVGGKVAMYINSNHYGGTSGSRWAIKGCRLRFTRLESIPTRYQYAFCHDVNPTDGTITLEILGYRDHDVEPTGNFITLKVNEIGRCEAEWPK